MWQKVAEAIVLPVQPLLATVPSFNMETVRGIVHQLRAVRGGEIAVVGRQREADLHEDLDKVAACSEHDFLLRVPICGEASIRWRCTRAAPGHRPARGWITEAVTVERGPGQFIIRSKDLRATRYEPCEYVFEWRCDGLVVVLREAKVVAEHAAPLHQMAWGIIHFGRILPPRMAVLPMPA